MMPMMPGSGWTREKEILTLDLYFKNGRRPLSANRPEVKSLANAAGLKPSAVTMRMGNFVACDPDNPNKGLSGVAKPTRAIWDEFAHDKLRLQRAANEIRRKYGLDAD